MTKGIYDTIYDNVLSRYDKWQTDDTNFVYALCVVTLLQTFNLFTLFIGAILLHIIDASFLRKYYFYILSLILYCINYVIIRKPKKILNDHTKPGRKENFAALIYVAITIGSFLSLFVI